MKNIYVIVLVFISTSLFMGCGLESEIDYETFYGGDKIVVHGFISVDSGAHIIVKKTIPPDKPNESDYIDNPSVWLYEKNEPLVQLTNSGASKFISPVGLKLSEIKSYSIHVDCEGYESVHSVPQQLVNKLFIDTVYISSTDTQHRRYCLTLKFDDIFPEENYFMYKTHTYYKGIDGYHSTEFISPFSVKKDSDYNSKKLAFEVEIRNHIPEEEDFTGFDSIQIELVTVSKDYYTYAMSAVYYDGSKNSEFTEYVYPIFSNIENGVGFFVSYESTFYTFFPPDSIEEMSKQ
ncbi:MAG: DUF4249 family protein [Prolixibacteraceae bacterium]|nr:DUF4249 family protein [Prolixibacteraceae bacterium]